MVSRSCKTSVSVGDVIGKLTVVDLVVSPNGVNALCRCACGREVGICRGDLKYMRSCGKDCTLHEPARIKREAKALRVSAYRERKHADYGTRLWRIWGGMKSRCSCRTSSAYCYYGGRGITYAAEWEHYVDFRKWALGSGYQEDLEIDRINNDGNYEPSNCRWVTHQVNNNNKRPRGTAKVAPTIGVGATL